MIIYIVIAGTTWNVKSGEQAQKLPAAGRQNSRQVLYSDGFGSKSIMKNTIVRRWQSGMIRLDLWVSEVRHPQKDRQGCFVFS